MKIVYFVLIVTVAAFCGAVAGSIITYAISESKRKKWRRDNIRKSGKNERSD